MAIVSRILCLAAVLSSLSGIVYCAEEKNSATVATVVTSLPLEGTWRLMLDPQGAGVREKWFAAELKSTDTVQLPGSLQAQGFGKKPSLKTPWIATIGKGGILQDSRFKSYVESEDFRTPFWMTPKRHYVGAAWYQRAVNIPADWAGQRITLHLERPHWQTSVWIDETPLGKQDSLVTPHDYDLTQSLTPGSHRLTLCIDNSMIVPVGHDAHSVSDQTQTDWNGIIGAIRLERTNPAFRFDDVQVYPNVEKRSVKVVVDWSAAKATDAEPELAIGAESFNTPTRHRPESKRMSVKLAGEAGRFEIEYALGEGAQLWDEFSPALYRLTLRLALKQNEVVERQVIFGLRQAGVQGTQFTINGRPTFLRGTHEGCIFPKTGYPPTDVASWKRIMQICRDHGLNHMRFHSWCPPEAAFVAADELGLYLQVECCTWAYLGAGSTVDEWLYAESDRILKTYGNHPSFFMMIGGNEPHGPLGKMVAYLGKLVEYWKQKDARRIYASSTAWPSIPQNQYNIRYAGVRLERTEQLRQNPATLMDYRKIVQSSKVPIVSHETVQWCAYPNLGEIPKYDGFLRAGQLEIARDMLSKAGLLSLAGDFLMASGRFQVLLHKAEIEAALRTPGFGGFQLLSLQDYPGQGLATVGILDAFWETKGYVTAREYRRFCAPTVPLARMNQLSFTSDQPFKAALEVAHYGPAALEAVAVWTLADSSGKVVASGELPKVQAPTGTLTVLGEVSVPLAQFGQAQKLKFEVRLKGTDFANDWDIWVYPAQLELAALKARTYVTRNFDAKAKEILHAGGTVLLAPKPGSLKGNTQGGFAPIFWNRVTFPSQKTHTVGLLCDPAHPAFAAFPTDSYCNWQWWELLGSGLVAPFRSKPITLAHAGTPLKPLVRAIDDWFLCRDLGYLFEAKVDQGRLIFCGMDIFEDVENRPVARQLEYSLLAYMNSPAFAPQQSLTVKEVDAVFSEPTLQERYQAKVVYVSSEASNGEGIKAIDGDPGTAWKSKRGVKLPQEIQVELNASVQIAGFTYRPGEASFNWMYDSAGGHISSYEFYVSDDKAAWGNPVAKGTFADSNTLQKVTFPSPVRGKFIRLVATGSHDPALRVTVGELGLITSTRSD